MPEKINSREYAEKLYNGESENRHKHFEELVILVRWKTDPSHNLMAQLPGIYPGQTDTRKETGRCYRCMLPVIGRDRITIK